MMPHGARTILILEDEPLIALDLQTMLETEGSGTSTSSGLRGRGNLGDEPNAFGGVDRRPIKRWLFR